MFKYLLSIFVIFAIIGCGGSNDPKSGANVKITGIAVDDLIVNGIVGVYPFGNKNKLLANGRTDNDDGTYDLNISYNGIVEVEVTCDSLSRMLNPASMVRSMCSSGLKLRSAAAVTENSGKVTVNISPLTEAVVKRMQQLGVSKANLTAANDDIKSMFGIDPLNDDPLKGDYKEVIGSFQDAAKDANISMADFIDEVTEDLKDAQAGDSDATQKLAEAMKKRDIENNIADNNGTFNPSTLPLTKDEIADKRFYIIEENDWGVLDFNQTHLKWQSMLNPNAHDVSTYIVENGKLKINGKEIFERVVNGNKYFILTSEQDDERFFLFKTLKDAETKLIEKSVNYNEVIKDSQSDSSGANPGFELISLETSIKDNKLIITVKSKGDIKNAIATQTPPEGYSNIFWIEIDTRYEFGLMKDSAYMVDTASSEGASIEGYDYKTFSNGVELIVPLDSIGELGEIFSVTATIGIQNEDDENIFDKIGGFITLKSIPITTQMVANKTFYTSWMENDEIAYAKFDITDQNITVTNQIGDTIEVEKGTYEITNSNLAATISSKEHNLTLLNQTLAYLLLMVEDDDGKDIIKWYRNKPVGYPSFTETDTNHAPEIIINFPPVTMDGVPIDMTRAISPVDEDQDALTMGIVKKPAHGVLKVNNDAVDDNFTIEMDALNSVIYMPPSDFNGTDFIDMNLTDGNKTTTQRVEITIFDKAHTLSFTSDDLNGTTFYTSWVDESGKVFAKIDANITDFTIRNVSDGGNTTSVSSYKILGSKILEFEDTRMNLLVKNAELWKFASTYDTNGDNTYGGQDDDPSEIEVWFLQKPQSFPNFNF